MVLDDTTVIAREWGRAIRDQRQLLGMTQSELATKVGVSQRAVSKWEKGQTSPSIRHQMMLARHLCVTPRALFQFPAAA